MPLRELDAPSSRLRILDGIGDVLVRVSHQRIIAASAKGVNGKAMLPGPIPGKRPLGFSEGVGRPVPGATFPRIERSAMRYLLLTRAVRSEIARRRSAPMAYQSEPRAIRSAPASESESLDASNEPPISTVPQILLQGKVANNRARWTWCWS